MPQPALWPAADVEQPVSIMLAGLALHKHASSGRVLLLLAGVVVPTE